MNFLSIKYFLAIVEEGSISSAARKLFISQQALSEHVKKLERELGVPLLKRGKTISLTVAGESFAKGGREVLRAKDAMLREIALVTDLRRSAITLGISTFEVPPFLPGLLAKFSIDYPEYQTAVEKRQVADLAYNMLGIDLFFSFTPLDDSLEHHLLLENDTFALVASKTLLSQTFGDDWSDIEQSLIKTQNLSLVKKLPFIMLIDRWRNRARSLDLVFESQGFDPIIGFQSDNGDLNASMCINGVAAYVGSAFVCKARFQPYLDNKEGSLRMFPLKTPGVDSFIALSHEKDKKLHHAEKAFILTAKNYLLEV